VVSSRKQARPGDILEVNTPRGLAYVQYAGKHPKYGTAIRVLPGFFAVRPKDWTALIAQEGYFTFYPVGVAVSQGAVAIAANQPVPPGRELPTRFRRAGWRTPEGRVTTWLICEGAQERLRTELSGEERRLFIASIWNHEFLVERLVEEWHPVQEPAEPLAIEALPPSEEPRTPPTQDKPGRLAHSLYFPTQAAGEEVASALRKRGFEVESRLGADDVNWLVLASHMLDAPEALPSVRAELEALAERHSGEYDGWELATHT
jgi:hypothetical protein